MTAPTSAPPGTLDVAPQVFEKRGTTYQLRLLRPDDAARLQQFFYSHTLETIQMRYGYAVTRMTPERARELVGVDQTRDLALGIVESVDGSEVIHAVGRYCLDGDGRSAEVAFVVRENRRRLGFASRLLGTLIDVARRRGLTALWGRVRRDNQPMLALFQHFGGVPVPNGEAGDSEIDVRIELGPRAPGAKPAGPTPGEPKARPIAGLRKRIRRLRTRGAKKTARS